MSRRSKKRCVFVTAAAVLAIIGMAQSHSLRSRANDESNSSSASRVWPTHATRGEGRYQFSMRLDLGSKEFFETTKRSAQELVEKNPKDIKGHYMMGLACFSLSRIYLSDGNELQANQEVQKAIDELEQVVSIDAEPYWMTIHSELSKIYEAEALRRDDQHMLKKAIEMQKESIKAWHSHGVRAPFWNLGRLYQEAGQIDKAILAYEHVLKVYGHDLSIHYELGELYRKKGLYEKAMAHYREALILAPGYVARYRESHIITRDGKPRKRSREDNLEELAKYYEGYVSCMSEYKKQKKEELLKLPEWFELDPQPNF